MKFQFRLAYYLFGLFLGGVFVMWFLKAKADDKGVQFCYLPNCRVLKDLRSKSLEIDSVAQQALNAKWVTLEDIKMSLQHGDVDFGKSNEPYKKGKIYVIEGKTSKNEDITITMVNYTNKVLLEKIEKK
ncbi:DUF4258 domain-containing protein [Flavobacterium channae]|uniref:DUF4258 domain-containing protein n=1 Tax=Flavobacterium channae TaxID=2897181 RepID=UPI001E4B4DDD|nr:DUF4258 domain-containing protein [Flavobacterium channae]UGS24729.1 DUF4258 domain-containing protein [Flavobacterium channae]